MASGRITVNKGPVQDLRLQGLIRKHMRPCGRQTDKGGRSYEEFRE